MIIKCKNLYVLTVTLNWIWIFFVPLVTKTLNWLFNILIFGFFLVKMKFSLHSTKGFWFYAIFTLHNTICFTLPFQRINFFFLSTQIIFFEFNHINPFFSWIKHKSATLFFETTQKQTTKNYPTKIYIYR